jgi:hypothetical protein
VTESPEDLLEPDDEPEDEPERDEDDEPRWSGEESLGLLPPD